MTDSKSIALNTIRAEHRALALVIDNIKGLIGEIRAERMRMDFPLFWSMIYYIDAFPDQLHHPKENDWLFSRVKLRTNEADALIGELLRQHEHEPVALGTIRKWLGNYEAGVAGSLEGLELAVKEFADFSRKHLRTEEHELLPIAESHLTSTDWDEIAKAFGENGDPLVGQHEGEQFIALFREIVDRTPAPLGLGAGVVQNRVG